MTSRAETIRALRREARVDWVLRGSLLALSALTLLVWASGEIEVGELFTPRRLANLRRFLTVEAVPYPMRGGHADWATLRAFIAGVWNGGGAQATAATLWIAVSAIVLAALAGTIFSVPAARTLAVADPYLLGPSERAGAWGLVRLATRLGCAFLRAVPEYILAFFLVQLLPLGAWPAVLALAIHNGGILGRLYGDTLENLPPEPLRALCMLGAPRRSLALLAAMPQALPRFLLYFFYRFETCVREATVLGMLGIASLGHEIVEARARNFYDQLLLLVAFGAGIVLAGDLLSHLARAWVRRAR